MRRSRPPWKAAAGALALGALLTGLLLLRGPAAEANPDLTLSVDANPFDSQPTSPGEIDPCVSVSAGDTLEIDIVVLEIENLLAWEVYLEYDATVVSVIGRNVLMFQQANRGSNVYDVSEAVPDTDGLYRAAAADTADPPSPDSGSGPLVRLTLEAIGPGISPAALVRRDINDDGEIDLAPFLRNFNGDPLGDEDGDSLFDGDINNAQIAVDRPCPGESPISNEVAAAAADDGGLNLLYVIGPLLAALLGLGTILTVLRLRRHAGSQDSRDGGSPPGDPTEAAG